MEIEVKYWKHWNTYLSPCGQRNILISFCFVLACWSRYSFAVCLPKINCTAYCTDLFSSLASHTFPDLLCMYHMKGITTVCTVVFLRGYYCRKGFAIFNSPSYWFLPVSFFCASSSMTFKCFTTSICALIFFVFITVWSPCVMCCTAAWKPHHVYNSTA